MRVMTLIIIIGSLFLGGVATGMGLLKSLGAVGWVLRAVGAGLLVAGSAYIRKELEVRA